LKLLEVLDNVPVHLGISGASAPASLKRDDRAVSRAALGGYFRGIRPGLIEASLWVSLECFIVNGISGASAPASLKRDGALVDALDQISISGASAPASLKRYWQPQLHHRLRCISGASAPASLKQ